MVADGALPALVFYWAAQVEMPLNMPEEERWAQLLLDRPGALFGLLVLAAALWAVAVLFGTWRIGRSPGMWLAGIGLSAASPRRVLLRPFLGAVSVLPLGLGLSFALLDGNSRGPAEWLLGMTWRLEPRPSLRDSVAGWRR
jgi:hypothetical protein